MWSSPVYGNSLENCRFERAREFESHRFHQSGVKMETINLFTIPVYRFKFEEHSELKPQYMEYLNDDSVYENNTKPGATLNFTSPNLHKLPLFSRFVDFCQTSLNSVMVDLGNVPSIQITGLWGTRHLNNGGHHRHTHGNSFLGGVYYLNGSDSTAGTNFYNPNKHHQQLIPARLPNANKKILNSWTSRFREGELIIFHAWLEHDTNTNRIDATKSVRHILSFNTMPLGKTNHDEFDRFNYQNIYDADMLSNRNERIA